STLPVKSIGISLGAIAVWAPLIKYVPTSGMRSAIGPVAASSTTVTILLVWATASATFFVPRLPRLTLSNVSSTEPILILMVNEPSGGVSPLGGWISTSISWVGLPTARTVSEGTALDDRLGS